MGAVGTCGEARLGTRLDARIACPGKAADRTKTIPLRETAPGSRAQDFYAHPEGLDFGAGVGIDLTAQLNYLKLRFDPLHSLKSPLPVTACQDASICDIWRRSCPRLLKSLKSS